MSLSVTCDWCESSFSVSERHAGKKTPCPNCGETIAIPALRASRGPDRRAPDPRSVAAPRRGQGAAAGSFEKKSFLVGLGVAGGVGLLLVLVAGIGLFAFLWGRSDASRDAAPQRPTAGTTGTGSGGVTVANTSGGAFGSSAPRTNPPPAPSPIIVQSARPVTPPSPPATIPRPPTVSAPVARPGDAPKNLADLIEEVEKSVVRIDVKYQDGEEGNGSGFVVDSDGTILTNEHVMEDAASATVVFSDGGKASIEGTLLVDPKLDVAVVRIAYPREKLRPLPLAKALPRKGEQVVACGAPFGLSFTASEGIISAIRSRDELRDLGVAREGTWIQTTTPISPGNSGGPLLDMRGEVVGMNTMTLTVGQNLNFSIGALDMRAALLRKSPVVTKLAPAPPVVRRPSIGGRPPYSSPSQPYVPRSRTVDSRTTDEGRRLLAGITEMSLFTSSLSFDTSGKIRDYVREMARRNADMSEIQLNSSLKAMMHVTMTFSNSSTSTGAQRLEMAGYVLVRVNEGGSETIHKVWEYSEDMGTIHRYSLAKGEIPEGLRRRVLAFYQKFRDDRAEAKKAAPPAAKKTAARSI